MKNKNGIISKIEKGIIFVMVLSFFFSSILSVNVVKASEVNSQINNSENVTDNVDTNENDELTNEEEKMILTIKKVIMTKLFQTMIH